MMFVAVVFLTTTSAFGITVQPREEFGTIQSIDFQTRRLVIALARDAKPLTLVWDSWTRFIQDSHFTTVEHLKRGMQITVYYHSPIFGDRFATKILWATTDRLRETKTQHHRTAVHDIRRGLTR
jgi:hypothetical protein